LAGTSWKFKSVVLQDSCYTTWLPLDGNRESTISEVKHSLSLRRYCTRSSQPVSLIKGDAFLSFPSYPLAAALADGIAGEREGKLDTE